MRGYLCSTALLTSLGLLAAMPVLSSGASAKSERDEIVVSVTRIPTDLDRVGSAVSVISAEDILGSQEVSLSDLITRVPSVSVSRNGGLGGVTSSFIRGSASSRTLVLLDGVELNDLAAPSGGFSFANTLSDNIERIEVLRGSQSTLYGSDAIGGVINIVSRTASEPFEARAMIEGGSLGTVRGHASVGTGAETYNLLASASYLDTKGVSAANKANGNTEKDGHENATFYLLGAVNPLEGIEIGGTLRYVDAEVETDSFVFGGPFPLVDGDEMTKTEEIQASLYAKFSLFGGRLENLFRGALSDIDRANLATSVVSFQSESQRKAIEYQGTLAFADGHFLLVGAEHEDNEMRTDYFGAWPSTTQGSADIDSLYAQLQSTFFGGLTLTGGIRYDDHERAGGVTTFRFTGNYLFAQTGTTLRASWGEGFKAPTLYQLFDGFSGNPNLMPEESKGWDVGVIQSLADGRVRLEAGYFHTTSDNEIDYSFTTFTFGNILATRSKGFEFTAEAKPIDALSIAVSYANVSSMRLDTDTRQLRRPKHQANLVIDWQPMERVALSTEVKYTGKRLDTAGVMDDYTVVDLRGSYELNEHIELFGRVENLFDETYEQIYGYGTPGIGAYLGVRARI